jgi:hypothetical protein
MLSWLSDRSRIRDMITLTCWSHAVVTFRMLMLSCLVYDFCRKVTTACDQHGNVIMSRVRLLSESHDRMWPTCWYYHVSCTTSVGKSRQHVTNMLMLSCLVYVGHMLSWLSDRSRTRDMITLPFSSHAVVTFRQKSYTRHDNINMLVTCCRDFLRLLSESHDSIWPTC